MAVYSGVTGNQILTGGGGYSAGSSHTEDSVVLAGNYSSAGNYESDGGQGSLTEEQPVLALTINSTVGSTTYSNLSPVLTISGSNNSYNIVSINISNTTSEATWENVANKGMTPALSIATSNYAWSIPTGSDSETKTIYIWAKNSLGVNSGRYSDSILLDVTPPNAPGSLNDVAKGTESPDLDTGQASTTNYYASWAEATDALSGRFAYQYRVLENNGAITNFTNTTNRVSIQPASVVMIRGNSYKMVVKNIDNAGNESATVTSDGVSIGDPNITLAKTAINKGAGGTESNSGLSGQINDIMQYNIAFQNTGVYPAEPASIYDILPTSTEYQLGSAAANTNEGVSNIYYITNVSTLAETAIEPVTATDVKGLRWEMSKTSQNTTGNVTFKVVLK